MKGIKKGSFPNKLVLSKKLISLKTKRLRKSTVSKISCSRFTFCNHSSVSDVKSTQTLLTPESAEFFLLFFLERLSVKIFFKDLMESSQHFGPSIKIGPILGKTTRILKNLLGYYFLISDGYLLI